MDSCEVSACFFGIGHIMPSQQSIAFLPHIAATSGAACVIASNAVSAIPMIRRVICLEECTANSASSNNARHSIASPCASQNAARKIALGAHLDFTPHRRYIHYMANSFIICDFGTNEDAAQQARHKLENWKQAFHLGKKLEYKFERKSDGSGPEASEPEHEKGKKKSSKSGAKKEKTTESPEQIRVLVRLSFSDHEKLTQQRWIERIPTEDPFKSASPEIIRNGEPGHAGTVTLFDNLD